MLSNYRDPEAWLVYLAQRRRWLLRGRGGRPGSSRASLGVMRTGPRREVACTRTGPTQEEAVPGSHGPFIPSPERTVILDNWSAGRNVQKW